MTQPIAAPDAESMADAHTRRLIEEAAELRMPGLFGDHHPHILHRVRDRGGVTTVALLTRDMQEGELLAILRYRLAQYLMAKFVYPLQAYEAGWEHEPLEHVSRDDVHVIAGSAATGEILCYATLRATTGEGADLPLRVFDRPLLPIEQTFGWGVYNHLRVLPEVPVTRIREGGRLIKNQRLRPSDQLGIRAPLEVGVALFRLVAGTLRGAVEAIVGDTEENVTKRNLDFFHCPTLMLRNAVPQLSTQAYLFRHFSERQCFPFAILTADLGPSMPRLSAVEEALSLPGLQTMEALLSMKRTALCLKSSLDPLPRSWPSSLPR